MSKPLTNEERENAERYGDCYRGEGGVLGKVVDSLNATLAAEEYWRESVKNAEFYSVCPFCGGRPERSPTREVRPPKHEADCPWLSLSGG